MTAKIIPGRATFDLVVFGGTGDLARRKLLPGALPPRPATGSCRRESRIIGVRPQRRSTRRLSCAQIDAALRQHVAAADLDEACVDRFLAPAALRRASMRPGRCRLGRARGTAGDPPSGCASSISRPSPDLFGPICRASGRASAWSRRRPASCSRSRSATTSPRRVRSTTRSARSSPRSRSSASITTSARRRCRT